MSRSGATNKQHNKSLHPTGYSFVRSSLRFRRRVSSGVVRRASAAGKLGFSLAGVLRRAASGVSVAAAVSLVAAVLASGLS